MGRYSLDNGGEGGGSERRGWHALPSPVHVPAESSHADRGYWLQLYQHPYYLEVAMPDEEKFMERSSVLIMAGDEEDKIRDHKAV